jgi:hypothetical protein
MNEEVTSKKILKKLSPWEYKKDGNMIITRNGDKYSIKRNRKETRKIMRHEKVKTYSNAKTEKYKINSHYRSREYRTQKKNKDTKTKRKKIKIKVLKCLNYIFQQEV